MFKKVLLLCFALFLIGCGYKPTSHYAKQVVGKTVFVDLKVNIDNVQNSVVLKQSLKELIATRFDTKVVESKDAAETIMQLSMSKVSISELQYDSQGYANLYRATVSINVKYEVNGLRKDFTGTNYHDFSTDSAAVISDAKKEEAIKQASSKALENILSKIAIQSFKK
jgi:hypothetical protein